MIPYRKVESLAACRMTEQQIADVLDIDLGELKREPGGDCCIPRGHSKR